MRARPLVVLAMLVGGLSVADCAPSLEASGERGGTIRQNQLRPGSDESHAVAMAAQYCSQHGRSAHIAREELGWFWSSIVTFDCAD